MHTRRFIDCFLAWALSSILVLISAYSAGVDPFAVSSYVRADGGLYLSIAKEGYGLVSCAQVPGLDPTQWCGNAGWMPGYPALIRVLLLLPIDAPAAGLIISNAFYFGCLILLREMVEYVAPDRNNSVCFLLAVVFPGAIYYHVVFPISMVMFFALLSLHLLVRERFLLASVSGACGSFAYSTGFLLCGVVGAAVLAARDVPWRKRIADAILYASISFAGFVAVLAVQEITVGRWDAFFLTQAKYGHGLHNPLGTIGKVWADLVRSYGNQEHLIAAIQSLFVGAVVLALLSHCFWRVRGAARIEWMAAVQVGLFWIFPLIMGPGVTLTRAEANLLPLTVLAAKLPPQVQAVILIVFTFLYFEVNVSFFKSILV